jgi:hypothetical protein
MPEGFDGYLALPRQTTRLCGEDFNVARNGRFASVYLFFDSLP